MFNDFNTLFSVRSMLQAIEQWKEPQTFFQRLFFNEIETHSTRFVEIDFYDEERTIAPFIHRRSTGQTFGKTGYDKFVWEPPYIKPKKNIEPVDLQETLVGEHPYDITDPGTRFIELRNRILRELDNMISRREELMAVQAVFDKSITIVDESGNSIGTSISFTRESELDFSATTAWSDTSNANPLEDIRKGRRLIGKHTGLNCDIAVHGSTAADEFIKNTEVKSVLDNRRYEIGSMRMERISDLESMGAVWMGQIEGVDHFRYDAWYKAPSTGTITAMIPEGKVALGCSGARNVRHYGAIESIEASTGMVRARRWPKFYDARDKDPEVYGIQIHSAPLPVTHQPDAFAVITT